MIPALITITVLIAATGVVLLGILAYVLVRDRGCVTPPDRIRVLAEQARQQLAERAERSSERIRV